jgi:[ribosomal protein S18]-alanine N-acetyltransferase
MTARLTLIGLRDGGARDLDAVDRVMAAAFDPRFGEAWTRLQVTGVLRMPGVWLTLAEVDDAPAGFALARETVGEVELLLIAVHPRLARRGVGGALLRSVLETARARGAATVHLEVRAGNDAAHLYAAHGFGKVGERRGYYRGQSGETFDAHTYSRTLQELR